MRWFRLPGKRVDEFAGELAQQFALSCPLDQMGRKTLPPRRIAAEARVLCERAARFSDEQRLGVYSKARLGNAFRWKLTDLGYAPELVEELTRELVFHISRK